jgi:hypothetical protein
MIADNLCRAANIPWNSPPVSVQGSSGAPSTREYERDDRRTHSFLGSQHPLDLLLLIIDLLGLSLLAALQFLEETLGLFQLFMLLQEDRHDDGVKRPGMGHHDPGLDVELGAIEQPIENWLIGFGECFSEREPTAAFCVNELAERRQGLAQRGALRR